jgi:hypothetical protein
MSNPNRTVTAEEADKLKRDELRKQLDDAKALQASQVVVIKTEEGRHLLGRHIRLLETLIDGKPSTPLPTRHHA